jgi:hypothetical protein
MLLRQSLRALGRRAPQRCAPPAARPLSAAQDLRSPRRKASALLADLRREELDRRQWTMPPFKAGDAVELDILVDMDAPRPQKVKGLVLGRANRGVDSRPPACLKIGCI